MKICFLVNQLSIKDGWGSYAVNLIEHLSKEGVDCLVLSSVKNKENDLSLIKDNRILPPLFTSRWFKVYFLIKNFLKIRKIIRESDIIHVLAEPYGLIAYLVCRQRPIIITFHGTYAIDALNKWYLKWLYKRVYKNVKKIICVSKFTQQSFLEKIENEKTVVINNGIDYQKFQFLKPKEQFIRKEKRIISVGGLKARKGYNISIVAIAQVKKKYPDLKYYIIGNQENENYFNQLKDLVNQYNLKENVIFLENVSEKDKIKYYYQSDLFLLTPINIEGSAEGFGLVYLEANACGKPVIGTYSCGAEDAVKNDYNGILVEQNNIKQTSEAIINILSNQNLSEKIGKNGKKWTQSRDWSKIVLEYIRIYKSI